MQPILRTATSALRQAGASSGSSSNASRVAASSIASQRIASRNGHGHAYATQAGMPMPPAPPGDSGKSGKKATKAQSGVASKSKPATTSSTAEPIVEVNASEPPVAPAQDGAEPPAVPPAPEEVLPPTTSGREIKPVSSLASQYLDATEIPASASERTGARSTSGKRPLSSIEKKRRNLGRATLAAMAVGSGIFAWNLGREWDSEKEKERLGRNVTIEEGMEGRWQRGQARFWDTLDYFNKPAWDPLLPEPLKPPHQKPYTLLLSLDDLLINSSWSREHGWRTAKRPGLDYFLAYLSQFYEIVIFTSQPSYTAAPIVEKLDPYMLYVLYRLFRESTRYSKELKDVVKDLSYLGRDLSKVILLDTVPAHFASQPENAIAMKPWDGNRADTDLVGMIPFLEAIAIYQVPDVRPILKNYAGKHIPSAWAEVEAEQKRAALAEYEASGAGKKGKLGGGFGSLFGVSNPQVRHDTGAPKTQLELGREFYQKAYLEEQKWWTEHKPEIEKAMEEDRQKQMQQATSSLTNYMSTFFGMPLPPKAEEAAATAAQNATPVPNQTR